MASQTCEGSRACTLLSVRDLAAQLNVSVRMVWRLHYDNQLPRAIRIGKCVRFRSSDIDKWVSGGGSLQRHGRRVGRREVQT